VVSVVVMVLLLLCCESKGKGQMSPKTVLQVRSKELELCKLTIPQSVTCWCGNQGGKGPLPSATRVGSRQRHCLGGWWQAEMKWSVLALFTCRTAKQGWNDPNPTTTVNQILRRHRSRTTRKAEAENPAGLRSKPKRRLFFRRRSRPFCVILLLNFDVQADSWSRLPQSLNFDPHFVTCLGERWTPCLCSESCAGFWKVRNPHYTGLSEMGRWVCWAL